MKKLSLSLAILACALCGQAQQIGMSMPKVANALNKQAIGRASTVGYNFVTIGASLPSSPKTADLSAFKAAVDNAFTHHLSVFVRLHSTVFGSGWGTVATPSYPPASLWPAIKNCRQQYLDVLYGCCLAHGVDPAQQMIEDGNEMDIGGVSGPCLGTWGINSPKYTQFNKDWSNHLAHGTPSYSYCKAEFLKIFPSWCWSGTAPLPEGTLPAVAGQMLCALRTGSNYHGFVEVAYTCEMADATRVGVNEVNSITGLDWAALLAQSKVVSFNCYEDAPGALTPAQAAVKWAGSKVPARVALLRSNVLVRPLLIGITETNLWESRVPVGKDSSVYRIALVRSHPAGIAYMSMFTSVAEDLASAGTSLYKVVNGVLVPIGTYEVGP